MVLQKEDNLELSDKPKIVKVDNSKIKPILESKTRTKKEKSKI